MKILFIHGAQRVKHDKCGEIYTDGSFNQGVWNRYLKITDKLSVMFNSETEVYDPLFAQKNFQYFDKNKIKLIELKNELPKNRLFPKPSNHLYKQIEKEVLATDFLILRVPSKASEIAAKIARKHNKPYLLEVVGCAFDSLWTHSYKGKMIAIPKYISLRNLVKKSQYVQYVTEQFLQERYPTKGRTYSISDVVLPVNDTQIQENRFKRIDQMDKKIITLGSIGAVDVRYKGYQYVLKTVQLLKKKGYSVKYQIIGGGNQAYLSKVAIEYGVENDLFFHGSLAHNKVIEVIDGLDLYIQPSLTEGLPRSLIESIHRGCPSIGSGIGGIPELLNKESLFNTKDPYDIVRAIEQNINDFRKMSQRNFSFSKKFDYQIIDNKRDLMFREIFEKECLDNE